MYRGKKCQVLISFYVSAEHEVLTRVAFGFYQFQNRDRLILIDETFENVLNCELPFQHSLNDCFEDEELTKDILVIKNCTIDILQLMSNKSTNEKRFKMNVFTKERVSSQNVISEPLCNPKQVINSIKKKYEYLIKSLHIV